MIGTKIFKVLISVFLVLSTPLHAECNLKTDVRKIGDSFVYTPECHRYMGKIYLENEERIKQIALYESIIELQKEQLALESERAELWRMTSYELEERYQKKSWFSEQNKLLYFGAGVILMLGASWAAGQAQQ